MMKRAALLLLALAAAQPALADDDCLIGNVRKFSVRALDNRLPDMPLSTWLEKTMPAGTQFSWEVNDCGEATGDAQLDEGRNFSPCVAVTAEVWSRDRDFILQFKAEDPLAAPFFIMASPDIASTVEFAWLGDIPAMLLDPLALRPVTCFAGDDILSVEKDAGLSETCRKDDGTLHGSHRSWFSKGLYLMEQGVFLEGQRAGDWIVCDRLEKCKIERYPLNLKRRNK